MITDLEKSVSAFAETHRFTSFQIGYRDWDCTKHQPYYANAHYDDAAPGQFPCADGNGATIAEALGALLTEVASRRNPAPGTTLSGSLPSPMMEAA